MKNHEDQKTEINCQSIDLARVENSCSLLLFRLFPAVKFARKYHFVVSISFCSWYDSWTFFKHDAYNGRKAP